MSVEAEVELAGDGDQLTGLALVAGGRETVECYNCSGFGCGDQLAGTARDEAPALLAVGLERAVVLPVQPLLPDRHQRDPDLEERPDPLLHHLLELLEAVVLIQGERGRRNGGGAVCHRPASLGSVKNQWTGRPVICATRSR